MQSSISMTAEVYQSNASAGFGDFEAFSEKEPVSLFTEVYSGEPLPGDHGPGGEDEVVATGTIIRWEMLLSPLFEGPDSDYEPDFPDIVIGDIPLPCPYAAGYDISGLVDSATMMFAQALGSLANGNSPSASFSSDGQTYTVSVGELFEVISNFPILSDGTLTGNGATALDADGNVVDIRINTSQNSHHSFFTTLIHEALHVWAQLNGITHADFSVQNVNGNPTDSAWVAEVAGKLASEFVRQGLAAGDLPLTPPTSC